MNLSLVRVLSSLFRSIIGLILFVATSLLHAQSNVACENYFEGRKVRFVTSTGAGGGFDRTARAIARMFAADTNARTQVANITGGDGYPAFAAVVAGNDSSINIGLSDRERILTVFDSEPGLRFDQLHILGIVSSEPVGWMGRPEFDLLQAIESSQQQGNRIVNSASDPYEAAIMWGLPAKSIGLSLAGVFGHSGSAESSSAVRRGDVDLSVYSLSRVSRLSRGGGLQPALILSDHSDDRLPNVPYLAGPGGLVDQLTANLAQAERTTRMQQAAAAARLSTSFRGLYVSRQVSAETLRCLEQTVSSILLGDALATEMELLQQNFTPVAAETAADLLLQDLSLLEELNDVLNQVIVEVSE